MIETQVIAEFPEYIYEILYINNIKNDDKYKNDIGSLLMINGDKIYGNIIILKTYLPNNSILFVDSSKDDIKIFLSKVKKKFCVSGSHKKIIELDDKENVFEFAGDIRDNLKDYLIAEYNKNEENIVIHG